MATKILIIRLNKNRQTTNFIEFKKFKKKFLFS